MSATETHRCAIPERDKRKRLRRLELKRSVTAEYDQYRVLSLGAIFSIIFAGLSILALLASRVNPFLLMVPLLGIMVGTHTVFSLRGRDDEYVGMGYAGTGLAISITSFSVGTFLTIFTYATEVPDGYQRISFSNLQPIPSRKDIPFSPTAEELSERKVFVKGYVYPDGQIEDIKQFILVPDMGTCCFGGQPKLTDMIQVTLEDPLRTRYSYARRSFAGTFRLAAGSSHKVGNVIYHLHADHAK